MALRGLSSSSRLIAFSVHGIPPENQVRTRLFAGGKWIRTIGPPPEIVVDPSGSRRDHRAKYGCLSARPRVRCLCPPGKTQHLLPKSVFDRPGPDPQPRSYRPLGVVRM